jgi:hypothetical protein
MPVPDAIISVNGASATSLVSSPVETGVVLIRGPAYGNPLALTPQLAWMELTGLPADQSLIRFDADCGAQLPSQVAPLSLDPAARRVYGLGCPLAVATPRPMPAST